MNFGGPGELIDHEVGALVELDTPEHAVRDIAALLRDVVAHPEDWRRRGLAGRRRVESLYSWSAKVDSVDAIYSEILQEG